MTLLHVVVVLALLMGLGLLPSYVLMRGDPAAAVLAPLLGGLTLSLAAVVLVILPGPLWFWALMIGLVAHGAAVMAGLRLQLWRGTVVRWATVWPLLVLALAAALPLLALRRPEAFYDARSIWFFHARWITAGHDFFAQALTNQAFVFSHSDYPPLVPAVVAGAWQVTGQQFDYRLGQIVVAMLNGCAVVLLARGASVAAGPRRRVLGASVGAFLVLGCFGVAGSTGTNGYADLLWSAAAVAAVLWGLVLPSDAVHRSTGIVLALVSANTKNEGLVAGACIAILIGLRWVMHAQLARHARRMWQSVATACLVAVGMLAWPVVVRLHGVASDIASTDNLSRLLRGDPAAVGRIDPLSVALSRNLTILWLLAAASLVALPLLKGQRRRLGLGHPAWIGIVIVVQGGSLVAAYLLSPADIIWLIQTSIGRTTIFLQLLALATFAVWGQLAADVLLDRTMRRSTTSRLPSVRCSGARVSKAGLSKIGRTYRDVATPLPEASKAATRRLRGVSRVQPWRSPAYKAGPWRSCLLSTNGGRSAWLWPVCCARLRAWTSW